MPEPLEAQEQAELTKTSKANGKPKQGSLAGMTDRKIEALHAAAEEYVKIRDERMALTKQEAPLRDALLALMHKNKKTHYVYDDLEITVVPIDETVKVKIHEQDEE